MYIYNNAISYVRYLLYDSWYWLCGLYLRWCMSGYNDAIMHYTLIYVSYILYSNRDYDCDSSILCSMDE